MEKILSCSADQIISRVQPFLNEGYTVKHIIAEHVAIAMTPSSEMASYGKEKQISGNIVVVLEK